MAAPPAADLELLIRSAADALGVTFAAPSGPAEAPVGVLRADLEYRIKELVNDAFKFMKHSHRKRLTAADVNNALRMRNAEPLYGFGAPSVEPPALVPDGEGFAVKDEEVNLDELINAPLPAVPLDVTYTAHWLAVEGVQPAIPQNPSQKPPEKQRPAAEAPLVKHVLSKSLLAYHEKMTTAVLSQDPVLRDEALKHFATDTGISELAPYLVQMASERVTTGLGNLDVLERMIGMLESLMDNAEVDLEPYIHQIMPTVLTCLVGKKLSAPEQDHWSLRRRAAALAARICREHGGKYPTLQPRTAKTLLRAFLDVEKPHTTHFGAVVGLGELGRETTRLLVLPNVSAYGILLERVLPDPADRQNQEADDAGHVFDAVVEVSARVIAEDLALPTAPANPQSYLLQTYGHYFANALFRTITAPQDNSILGNPLEDLMEL